MVAFYVVAMDDTDNPVIIVDNVNDEFCDADNLVVLMSMILMLMTTFIVLMTMLVVW